MKLFGGRTASGAGAGTEQDSSVTKGQKSGPEPPAEPAGPETFHAVRGERSTTLVNRARSLQSRITDGLAIGLMSLLALGALVGYYAHTLKRGSHALAQAQRAAGVQAQGDSHLPPLGPIVGPKLAPPAASPPPAPSLAQTLLGPAPELPSPPPSVWNRAPSLANTSPPTSAAHSVAGSLRLRALEQQLEGPVFAQSSAATGQVGTGAPEEPDTPSTNAPAGPPWESEAAGLRPVSSSEPRRDSLAALLQPTVTPAAQASVLPTQRFLLPKGASIDCTLETAIDSTLPGMTTCVTATDTFSADGTVVLLERGTQLVGETRGEVQQGQARVFVLWTEARAPSGVVVPLDSPATDALGRSGLAGKVNTHFWQRFGAAILVSVIDGGVQAGIQATGNGGTVIVNPATSEQIMTDVLQGTINIPPTIVVHQGTRVEVLVARDVDFRSVYRLTLAHRVLGAAGSP